MTNEEQTREAMAKAICEADVTAPDPDAVILVQGKSCKAWEGRLEMADAALAADPLRAKLGKKVVEAIMAGEAGVFPLQDVFGDSVAGHCFPLDGHWVRLERLDTPVEAV